MMGYDVYDQINVNSFTEAFLRWQRCTCYLVVFLPFVYFLRIRLLLLSKLLIVLFFMPVLLLLLLLMMMLMMFLLLTINLW
jgi:hypothetical protein